MSNKSVFCHLFERLLEELPICMAPVLGVVPVERPMLLVWSELTLNDGEVRMLCDDRIKPHNFRIDVDTALLSASSTFGIEPNEIAVILRGKTKVGHYGPDGCSCFVVPHFAFELFSLSGCQSSYRLELKDFFPTL